MIAHGARGAGESSQTRHSSPPRTYPSVRPPHALAVPDVHGRPRELGGDGCRMEFFRGDILLEPLVARKTARPAKLPDFRLASVLQSR